jgi:amino acid adenylation domain-containing protein
MSSGQVGILRNPSDGTAATAAVFLHELVDRAATEHAVKRAIADGEGSWTYQELADRSRAHARWLTARGVARGDRVAVVAAAVREVLALAYACSRVGAVFVPLSPKTPRYQFEQILADAEPALLLADGEQLDWSSVPSYGVIASSVEAARRFGPSCGESSPPEESLDPSAPVLLLYTSGSTAQPKAVISAHTQILFVARAVADRLRYQASDVVYCALPLSFDYGLYQGFLCALSGAELVLADAAAEGVRMLGRLRSCRATVVPVVPSLATMLLGLAGRGRPSAGIRLFTNTGEALQPTVADELRARFPGAAVQVMYGTTECKRITIMEADGDRDRPRSVGRPLDGTSVRIIGPTGDGLGPGEIGEITVRGPHLMSGYWRAPELTGQVYRTGPDSGEQVLYTGDFGWLDEEGYLYFEGRRDQIFKRNGTRMSTVEIEAAAQTLPGVEAAVVMPPSPARDALLYVRGTATPMEIATGLRHLLEPAKVPRLIRVLEDFPLTANGKIDRQRLAADHAGGEQ